MHVNLWMPAYLINTDGKTLQAVNLMCNLTQFVVSTLVENPTSELLTHLFMENVVPTFWIITVVVVDTDSKFLCVFKDMRSMLKIHFWPLARGNHTGNIVECYH